MILRYLAISVILFTVVEVSQAISASACYGIDPECDFYSMQCSSSHIIRLHNLYAGRKNETVCTQAEGHCNNSNTCCHFNGSDIYEHFSLENKYNTYKNCSGRQTCTEKHAPWQLLNNTVTSTYVHLEYSCEDESTKIQFCGGTDSAIYSQAEIMFNGSAVENFDPNRASKNCECTVTNIGAQQNVVLTEIDVRLESYFNSENDSSADCSSATLRSKAVVTTCVTSDEHFKDNFHLNQNTLQLVQDETTVLALDDLHVNGSAHDSPTMVWISLKAASDREIRVTCREVEPTESTTTTTTTTTTTPTPTTTTTTPTPTSTTTTPTSTTTTTTPASTTTTTTPILTTTTTTSVSTTTTTTPIPTTTTTTPTPTTTTPIPTTTTTTPTQTTTTTPTPTTTTPTPTTTTTTPIPTTTITTPIPTTTTTTPEPTTTTVTTSGDTGQLQGDGDSDQNTAVYLAIAIPLIVGLFVITSFFIWIYWTRTSPRREKFHFMNGTPRSDVYNTFRNIKILDDYLDVLGVEARTPAVLGTENPPLSTFISVPNTKRTISVLSNGSTNRSQSHPYVVPVRFIEDEHIYSTLFKDPVKKVIQIRLDPTPNQTTPTTNNTLVPKSTFVPTKMDAVFKPEPLAQSDIKSKTKPDYGDGSVVIHVDNLNLPPASIRSTNANSFSNASSTQRVIGSTPGNIKPESRNSQAAIITSEPVVDRNSSSVYVLPGSSPENGSVLFVK